MQHAHDHSRYHFQIYEMLQPLLLFISLGIVIFIPAPLQIQRLRFRLMQTTEAVKCYQQNNTSNQVDKLVDRFLFQFDFIHQLIVASVTHEAKR